MVRRVVLRRTICRRLWETFDSGRLGARWGVSENNRRAKYYKLTAAGRRQLDVETGHWKRIAIAISFALEAT